jgi:hypothetical protein
MGELLHGRHRLFSLGPGRDPQILQVIDDQLYARNDLVMTDGGLQFRAAEEHLGGDDLPGKGRIARTVFERVGGRAGDYLPDEGRGFGIEVIEVLLVEDPAHAGQADQAADGCGTDSRPGTDHEHESDQPGHRGECPRPRHPCPLACAVHLSPSGSWSALALVSPG